MTLQVCVRGGGWGGGWGRMCATSYVRHLCSPAGVSVN